MITEDFTLNDQTERIKRHIDDLKYSKFSTILSRTFLKGRILFIDFGKAKILSKQDHPFNTIIRESLEACLRSREICNNNVSF